MAWEPKIHPSRRNGKIRGHTFRCGGVVHWLPANPRAAKAAAAKHYADWLAKQNQPAGQPTSVAGLIEVAKRDNPHRAWALTVWADFGGHVTLSDMKPDHLEALATWLKKKYDRKDRVEKVGLSAASIHNVVTAALAACRYAVDHDWLRRAPRRPKLEPASQRAKDIPAARLSALFAALPDRAGKLFRFCLETGARPGEACQLRWEQVDLEHLVATLTEHKTAHRTGTTRTIFLSASALVVLQSMSRASPWVFLSRLGKPYTPDGLRSILKSRGANPYQLRHTFAQFQSDAGVDDATLAGLMGHRSTLMVQRYRHIRAQRLRDAAARLASPLQPPTPAAIVSASPDRSAEKVDRPRKGPRANARKASRLG